MINVVGDEKTLLKISEKSLKRYKKTELETDITKYWDVISLYEDGTFKIANVDQEFLDWLETQTEYSLVTIENV